MTLYDQWRERHGQKRSGGRLIIYLILLAVTLLLILKAGDFSRGFTEVFLRPQQPPEETR
jgi:hypothetical protein